MINSKTVECIVGLFFFLVGIGLYLLASRIETGQVWMINIGFWPKWLGIGMVLFSLIMLVQARLSQNKPINFLPQKASILLIGSLIIYLVTLPLFGYFIGSIIWLAALGIIAGERSMPKILAWGIFITVIGYMVFWQVLYVRLPIGVFEAWLGLDALLYR